MAKFRKKPVVIEAYRWTVGGGSIWPEWLAIAVGEGDISVRILDSKPIAQIQTLEGLMSAMPGDWIIRGVKGELYPCKPDIFDATYEPA